MIALDVAAKRPTSPAMKPGLAVLICYALPAFALATVYLPLFTYVAPFYVAERNVDLAALGTALILIRLFDAISDPVMGWLSDRTPARWGRRRLWMALSVPVILIAGWNSFVPPPDAGLGHAVLWLTVLVFGWTMAQTPYAAWGAEIAPDYLSRLQVTGWREMVVIIGTLATTVLYFVGGAGGAGLTLIAMVLVIALPVTVAACIWGVPDKAGTMSRHPGLAEGLRTLAANSPFRRLLLAWFVNGAANALPATLFLFFVSDRLGDAEAAGWLIVIYFLSAVAGVPVWGWVARQLGKHRAWGWAMIYTCAIFGFALTLGHGDVTAFAVISVLTGLALGADLSLPPAIQADVVALDTRETGVERAGLFFALWQVATKAALALSSGSALIALGWVGFETGQANSNTALVSLSVLYAGVPIALKLIAVALMWHFPVGRAEVAKLVPGKV